MEFKIIKIGPALAKEYLAKSAGNRSIRPHRVDQYAGDMSAGNWHLIPFPIVFAANGLLYDGHHRLHAIIRAGVTLEMVVCFGMDIEAAIALDQGMPRASSDALSMGGFGIFSGRDIAAMRVIEVMPKGRKSPRKLSNDELMMLLMKHFKALAFANEHLGNATGIDRAIRALVVRAWYRVDPVRLADFCRILRYGIPVSASSDEDSAAFVLLKYMQTPEGRASSDSYQVMHYRKAQSCLAGFVKRVKQTKVYGTEEDLFPLI